MNYSGSQSAINGKRFRIALWRRLIWNLREPLFTSPQNKHQKSDRGHEGSQGNDRSQEGIPTGAAPRFFDFLQAFFGRKVVHSFKEAGRAAHPGINPTDSLLRSWSIIWPRIEVHSMRFSLKKICLSTRANLITRNIMPNKASPSSPTRQCLSASGQPTGMMKPAHTSTAEQTKRENWWDLCPICGSKLLNHKCRFVCTNLQCHFFMSCSEFDL